MIQLWRQAARSLAMHPGFSVFVLLIVALCIGGNAAVFSAAEAVLFRPLPYKDTDRLVTLTSFHPANSTETDLSWTEVVDWGRRSRLLENVSPFLAWQDRLLIQKDSVERIRINYVSSSYLNLMGVKPQLGRLFSPQEDGPPGSAPEIILSYPMWERIFAKDPAIIGKRIQLNDKIYSVIGVMPKIFYHFLQWRFRPIDAWIPANMAGITFQPTVRIYESREERVWFGLARMKPGVTLEQLRQEGEAIGSQLQREFPDTNKDYVARITPIREAMFPDLHSGVRVLLAGAGLVLLLGCANIANLFLVRLAGQRKELSLRLALGANRRHLTQYVLAEGLILALVGGVFGVLLGMWGTKLLAGLMELPPFTRIELDGRVLAFSLVITLLTGFLFALPPAISVARMDSRGTLQHIRAAGGRNHSSRGLGGLLVFQVAAVVILLIVASLLLRSFWRLQSTGVDYNTARLLTLRMGFGGDKYADRSRVSTAMAEVLRQVQAVPGVEAATIWGTGIPGIATQFTELQREGAPATDPLFRADLHLISPGALKVLGVPVLRGREFTPQDTRDVPRVAIISQGLARTLWPGQDPIGKRFYRPNREQEARVTVVGVIPDVRFQGRFVEGNPHLLFPNGQVPGQEGYLLVRTGVDVTSMTRALKEAVRQVDSQIPVFDILTMDQRLRDEEKSQRLNATVVTGYSLLALILVVLGLYGMLAYSVVQKTWEIGIRMALGAERRSVLRLIMTRGLVLVGGGVALGLGGGMVLTRFLSHLLYGVTAADPLTFVGVIILFTAVALLASYLPARQALKVQPTIALRYD